MVLSVRCSWWGSTCDCQGLTWRRHQGSLTHTGWGASHSEEGTWAWTWVLRGGGPGDTQLSYSISCEPPRLAACSQSCENSSLQDRQVRQGVMQDWGQEPQLLTSTGTDQLHLVAGSTASSAQHAGGSATVSDSQTHTYSYNTAEWNSQSHPRCTTASFIALYCSLTSEIPQVC